LIFLSFIDNDFISFHLYAETLFIIKPKETPEKKEGGIVLSILISFSGSGKPFR